jgi:hypothetical protein
VDIETSRWKDRYIDRKTQSEMGRLTDRQKVRQADEKTDRRSEMKRHT